MLTVDRTHTLAALKNVKLIRPDNAGHLWKGVKHYDLVVGLIDAIQNSGYNAVTSDHVTVNLSRNDADMIGTIEVEWMSERTSCLGFTASNAIRQSLTLYVGGTWNTVPLVVSELGGHIRFPSWKYDINFNLKDVCEEMVHLWNKEIENFPAFARAMSDRKLKNGEASQILADAADRKLIPWKVYGVVWSKWRRGEISAETKNALTLMGLIAEYSVGSNRVMDNLHNTFALGQMVMKKEKAPA